MAAAAAAAAVVLCTAAWAQPAALAEAPPEVAAALPGAVLQGSGTLRVLFFHVYDARLWRGGQRVGADFAETPLALTVTYARKVDGADLVGKTLEQLRRQAGFDEAAAARWAQALRPLLPTVQPGDRLTAVNAPGHGLRMFLNGSAIGHLDDPRLAHLFFGIWLSPQTSEPALRQSLLGDAATAG